MARTHLIDHLWQPNRNNSRIVCRLLSALLRTL
jgi:hypothetical protein